MINGENYVETNLTSFIICPNCGSTEYLADYPAKGHTICLKCGHESAKIELKVWETYEEMPENCPFCGKEAEDDETLLDTDSITVFKCKNCGKLDGYKYAYGQSDGDCGLDYDDRSYSPLQIEIAEQEGKPIFPDSRKIAKTLQKMQNSPYEKCKERLELLINEKNQIMKPMGITEKTVTEAKQQAMSFMARQKSCTEKQLTSLFSAAIMVAQEKLLRCSEIPKKETTERQLKRVFSIDRKTIRKWKRTLEENLRNVKLGVSVRQNEGSQRRFVVVELPTEIASVIKLNTPYKDKCDFCEETKLLTWRISYTNQSWSDICTSSHGRLEDMSFEKDWKIQERTFSQ
jgi:Zn ribbon nucleic-acid-binding protein